MQKKVKMLGLLVAAALILGACAAPKAVEPTPDLAAVKTQAVQTAMAQMTLEAAMKPSPTVALPTLAPVPTYTQVPLATIPVISSGSSSGSGSSGSSGGSGGVVIPTWTPAGYKCELVNQDPIDGWQWAGDNLDVVFTLKNTGIVTWNAANYYVKWLGYDDLSPTHTYPLSADVAPGKTVKVIIDVDVPLKNAQYRTQWALINDNGEAFCKFYYYVSSVTQPTPKP